MTQNAQQPDLRSGWSWATIAEVTAPRGVRIKPTNMADAPFIGLEHVEAHTMWLLDMGQASNWTSGAG